MFEVLILVCCAAVAVAVVFRVQLAWERRPKLLYFKPFGERGDEVLEIEVSWAIRHELPWWNPFRFFPATHNRFIGQAEWHPSGSEAFATSRPYINGYGDAAFNRTWLGRGSYFLSYRKVGKSAANALLTGEIR